MRWWKATLLAGLVLGVSALALLLGLPESQPSYEGRSLRRWVWQLHWDKDRLERARATVAIRHIGTNGIPWLLRWISYDPIAATAARPRWLASVKTAERFYDNHVAAPRAKLAMAAGKALVCLQEDAGVIGSG